MEYDHLKHVINCFLIMRLKIGILSAFTPPGAVYSITLEFCGRLCHSTAVMSRYTGSSLQVSYKFCDSLQTWAQLHSGIGIDAQFQFQNSNISYSE